MIKSACGVAMIALLFAIAGCSTTAPVQTIAGTYMISAQVPFTGPSGALSDALKKAKRFCSRRGEVVRLASSHTKECMLHGGCGEAKITFLCARATH